MSNLAEQLKQFIGTEQWHRHPLNRNMLFTDGVKFIADTGGTHGCYWLLDIIATEAMAHHKTEPMVVTTLTVGTDETATMTIDDGNGKKLTKRDLTYTDMDPGTWVIWLVDNVALLPSEY